MKTTQLMGSLAVCALTLIMATNTQAAITVIDTTRPGAGAGIGPIGDGIFYGNPVVDTIGQTFTVADTNTTLESFTVRLQPFLSPNPINFSAHIMAWDGLNNQAAGPVLYSSDKQTVINVGYDFAPFTFTTGGLTLTQDEQYIMILSTSQYLVGNDHHAFIEVRLDSHYSGGSIYKLFTNGDFSQVTSSPWTSVNAIYDFEFIATFSGPDIQPAAATPEPTSAALLALGAGVIGMTTRRRRQA